MSIPAFAWAMERGRALKLLPSERLVLIYLADMANGARVCWPGQETIVLFTGLALRTVRSAVDRLAGRGLIRVEDSPGRVMRYHILRDDTPANDDGVGKPNGKVAHNPGNSSQGKRLQPRQNVPTHPGKSCPEPRDISTETPAKCLPDPYLPKKETLERGACAPEAKTQDLDSGVKEASEGQQEPEPTADPVAAQQAYADAMRAIRLRNPKRLAAKYPANSVEEQIAATQGPPPPPPELKLNPKLADAVLAARAALIESAARLGRMAA